MDLARELRRLLRPDAHGRPFIADGSPFNSDVAIVGVNPGSTMPFWDFWTDRHGFSRDRWIEAYYARPGARRNATRNRIEILARALRPLRLIELNAYPYATKTEAEITREMKDPRVLHLMLRVARPRAIFLFGREPARTVAALLRLEPPAPGTLTSFTHEGRQVLLFAEPHLSRGWSYARVEAMASSLRHELRAPAGAASA